MPDDYTASRSAEPHKRIRWTTIREGIGRVDTDRAHGGRTQPAELRIPVFVTDLFGAVSKPNELHAVRPRFAVLLNLSTSHARFHC